MLDKLKSDKVKQGIKNALKSIKKKKTKKKRKRKGKVTSRKGKTTTGKAKVGSSDSGDGDGGGDGPDPPDKKDFEKPKKEGLSINDELRLLAAKLAAATKTKREEAFTKFRGDAKYKKL